MATCLISSIKIEKLFGLYTYDIPCNGISSLSNATILYGDNGVGKSTLLRAVFHLLSPLNNRGHRTALYQLPFLKMEVLLSSGIILIARFTEEDEIKVLILEILEKTRLLAAWDYQPKRSRPSLEIDEVVIELDENGNRVFRSISQSKKKLKSNPLYGQQQYLETLARVVPALFILNAERRLDSDSVSDPSDEVEIRRTLQYGEPKSVNELVGRSREIALSQALSNASRWISRKAVLGANKGSMNVHSVYEDVLKRLLAPASGAEEDGGDQNQKLLEKLSDIDFKTAEYARYELSTHLPTNQFSTALRGGNDGERRLVADLLKPYITSVESRLAAVEPIYQLIDRFVSIINGLLLDKEITFKLSAGFNLQNKLKMPLVPSQLSSGEQQLLLLFCNVLTARDSSSVFMIDEPEISLNVKWQRKLVQSLLDITSEADIQFIFASHSIELLTQHRDRVVKLVDKP